MLLIALDFTNVMKVHCMIDILTLTRLPQEQLALASSHERDDVFRYRRLALDFLHHSFSITRLMASLSRGCEKRLEALAAVANRLDLGACVAWPPKVSEDELSFSDWRQTLIINNAMASEAMLKAVSDAYRSKTLSCHLLETNSTPELETLLWIFSRQKHLEYNRLKAYHENCIKCLPDAAVKKEGRSINCQ